MGVFFIFLWYLWSNYWWFLTSGPLVVEPLLEYLVPGYEDWVNQYVSRRKRRQIAYSLSLFGIFTASFFAFQDVYLKLEAKEQELAQIYKTSGMRGTEESTKAIEKLREENKQLNAELNTTHYRILTLEASLKPRHLTPEAQQKFIDALASHNGSQFGVLDVATSLGCQECMMNRDEIVKTINIVPGWRAQSVVEMAIRSDLAGLVIGVKDLTASPPVTQIIADALKAAEVPFTIRTVNFLSPDGFILIIGNKP